MAYEQERRLEPPEEKPICCPWCGSDQSQDFYIKDFVIIGCDQCTERVAYDDWRILGRSDLR